MFRDQCPIRRLMVWAVCVAALCGPAQAQDDQRADALFETASAAYKLKRYEDSGKKFYDFMAGFPNDPRSAEAQYYVGRSYLHRNYLNKAIEELGYVIEDFPNSVYAVLAHHDRAQCYLKTRQAEEALKDMHGVIEAQVKYYPWAKDAMLRQCYDNHVRCVNHLCGHYVKNKQYDEAVAVLRRLPREMEAFRRVVNLYYSLKDYAKIRDLIDGLSEKNEHEGFKYLIEFYGKRKAYNQLKGIFAKLLEKKKPDKATDDLVWTTAWSFRHIGWAQWGWAMKQISGHYPRMARPADYELAKRNWQSASYQDDLELFVIKYRTGADVDTVLRWKGITLERMGKVQDARATYRRISHPAIGHWFVAGSYNGAYAKTKDHKGAIGEYTEVRKAFYSMEWSAMAQWRVAEIYRDNIKDVDQAVAAFRQIVKRFAALSHDVKYVGHSRHRGYVYVGMPKRDYGPAAQLALSDVLRSAKLYDNAIMEYRTLVGRWPKTNQAPVGAYRTGLCYEGNDDAETAIKVFKSVLRRYPKTGAASDAHTRLEVKYDIADTTVTDDLDFFTEEDTKKENYLENPDKMK